MERMWNAMEHLRNGRADARGDYSCKISGGDALKGHTRSHPEHDG